jgi:hypothetical protein
MLRRFHRQADQEKITTALKGSFRNRLLWSALAEVERIRRLILGVRQGKNSICR